MADSFIEDKGNKVNVNTLIEGKTGDIDFNTLKSGGLIKQRQKDKFTVRLRCPGGRVPLSKLEKVVAVAKRYAGDYIHLSFRQSLELPYHVEKAPSRAMLRRVNLYSIPKNAFIAETASAHARRTAGRRKRKAGWSGWGAGTEGIPSPGTR